MAWKVSAMGADDRPVLLEDAAGLALAVMSRSYVRRLGLSFRKHKPCTTTPAAPTNGRQPRRGSYLEQERLCSHELDFWGGDLASTIDKLDHVQRSAPTRCT